MDADRAILLANIILKAYDVPSADISDIVPGANIGSYMVLSRLIGNDLATDINPNRAGDRISYGFVLRNGTDAIIAIRGTEGVWEWVHDLMFLPMPCPVPRAVGFSEDGFSAIYKSLSTTNLAKPVPSLIEALQGHLAGVKTITVCGHSLGGALATLVGLDAAINSPWDTTVYTFASPRVGDPLFVANYNHVVPMTYRIANRADIVPKMPTPPLYEHVTQLVDLNPTDENNKPIVKFSIPCEHSLTTYAYLIGTAFGAKGAPSLEKECAITQQALPTGTEGLI